ncbi:MAG: gliding motility-associated C-terminal domain-containing protein, partial [Bacteroidota bacterium]
GELEAHDLSTLATGIEWRLSNGQGSTENTAFFTIEQADSLTVQLIATTGGICFDTTEQIEVFHETPVLTVSQEPSCTVEGGTTVSIETPLENFVEMTGDDYDEPGTFHPGMKNGEYQVKAISPDGCVAQVEVFVSPVQELFIHLAQYFFEIDMGQEVQLEAFANQLGVTYAWSPAADLDDASAVDPVAKPLISTYFAVAVTNVRGCVKYDTAKVVVHIDREKGIYVPNTFTPDDSGHNDFFRLRNANPGLTKINLFKVFDRWGEVVFEAHECQPETSTCAWDGDFRGQKAEMGMYVWMAELEFLDGVTKALSGTVELIR